MLWYYANVPAIGASMCSGNVLVHNALLWHHVSCHVLNNNLHSHLTHTNPNMILNDSLIKCSETRKTHHALKINTEVNLVLKNNISSTSTLQWHHNGRDGVSNHHPYVYSGADHRKYQSSAPLAFVPGIHRWPVNSPHKGPVTRKMFPFDDVIMKTHSGALWMPICWGRRIGT